MAWDVLIEGGWLMCDRRGWTGGGGQKNREKCGRRLWTAPYHALQQFLVTNYTQTYADDYIIFFVQKRERERDTKTRKKATKQKTCLKVTLTLHVIKKTVEKQIHSLIFKFHSPLLKHNFGESPLQQNDFKAFEELLQIVLSPNS